MHALRSTVPTPAGTCGQGRQEQGKDAGEKASEGPSARTVWGGLTGPGADRLWRERRVRVCPFARACRLLCLVLFPLPTLFFTLLRLERGGGSDPASPLVAEQLGGLLDDRAGKTVDGEVGDQQSQEPGPVAHAIGLPDPGQVNGGDLGAGRVHVGLQPVEGEELEARGGHDLRQKRTQVSSRGGGEESADQVVDVDLTGVVHDAEEEGGPSQGGGDEEEVRFEQVVVLLRGGVAGDHGEIRQACGRQDQEPQAGEGGDGEDAGGIVVEQEAERVPHRAPSHALHVLLIAVDHHPPVPVQRRPSPPLSPPHLWLLRRRLLGLLLMETGRAPVEALLW